ncbi:type II toxin-antitoxin system VapC family toxin [Parenemella sanctibonifatiensis]|uniref:type II toxin-antitoxin system VapC family toxin n=1 Tax=Parenemella sanctibonifatiensis TaxID=2016505 RepID=UPI001E468195|nr:type II toxin-antitoxin system VapC family toxin [Parenemella sanctibonifatiensis]
MRVLLDTHVVLWLAGDADKVPAAVRSAVAGAEERWVSSASAMEVATKARLGKLPQGRRVIDAWSRILAAFQAEELPLSAAHMAGAGALPWEHRDPFDRMLVAQAQLEGLRLVTSDTRMLGFEDVSTLEWR